MGRNSSAVVPAAVASSIRWMWASAQRSSLLLLPVLFLGVFYVYPVGTILGISLAPEGRLDLGSFREIIESAYYRETLWFTAWQAALSTLLTLGLALPSAYLFTRYTFPGKSLLLALATLPFVLPTVVTAAAFDALLGSGGLVNDLLQRLCALDTAPLQLERTLTLIVIAHVFYNYAAALRIISGYWANQNMWIEDAARVLGCSGWRLWLTIRLPMLMPAILGAGVLVFVFCFTSFGVVLILGGVQYATLEVEIYRQSVTLFGGLPIAGALSLVQIGFMGVLMLAYTRLQRPFSSGLQSANSVTRTPTTRSEKLGVAVHLLLMSGLLLAPLLALVGKSLNVPPGSSPFVHYAALLENPRGSVLFVAPGRAVLHSLGFALMTMLLAVVLGVLSAYAVRDARRRWLDVLLMLPLATSAVTLGFGFLIALDSPPLNLRASPWLIPIAHVLVALPFVVRSVLPALQSIPPEVHQAAGVLGAAGWRKWLWIDLPLIWRGIAVGALFAFTVSMGEFGASLFIARPDTPTIPIVIYRLLGQPGAVHYGQAMAMSVILLAVCAGAFVTIERLRPTHTGIF